MDPAGDSKAGDADAGPEEDPEEETVEEVIILRKQPTDQFSSIWMKAQKLNITPIYPTPTTSSTSLAIRNAIC